MDDVINYMGHHWLQISQSTVTVGVNEEACDDLSGDLSINLPEQDDRVSAGQVCGEIETDSGPLNLYSPVDGTVIEINDAVLENPDLLLEDPHDEGWLFKIEASNQRQLDALALRSGNDDDIDDDEDVEDDEESEEGYADD